MIDVKRTTLVPSLRALTAFKTRGELDALMVEYSTEREVVAAAISRSVDEIIVELSPAARVANERELLRAPGVPSVRRRLVSAHAIRSEPYPTSTHRVLTVDTVGIDRRVQDTWLWFAGDNAREAIAAVLAALRVSAATPQVDDWPVADAVAIGAQPSLKPLLRALAELATVVDVDHNGRPFPGVAR